MMGLLLTHPATASDDDGDASNEDNPSAIAVFGGLMTDNEWEDAFAPWSLDFRDSTLVGLAASHRIGRFDDRFGFEIEGQVVRHLGDQDRPDFDRALVVGDGDRLIAVAKFEQNRVRFILPPPATQQPRNLDPFDFARHLILARALIHVIAGSRDPALWSSWLQVPKLFRGLEEAS
jgi:hypothetical protein